LEGGYRVLQAEDSQQALRLLQSDARIDLLLGRGLVERL
jgi:hypothetical protein